MTKRATKCYKLLHSVALSLVQENAVDALVTGKTDAETAALVGVDRTTITRWRLYSPTFQAALNVRRAEVWSTGLLRIQGLIPKALDVLAEELGKADSPNRLKAAIELLRLVPPNGPIIGPTDPDEIVRRRAEELRLRIIEDREKAKETAEMNDDYDNSVYPPTPTADKLIATVLEEINTRLGDTGTAEEPQK